MKKLFIFIVITLQISLVWAGGSDETVIIEEFTQSKNGNYILIVKPQLKNTPGYKEPYMGNCKVFTVHGEYDEKWWKKYHGAKKERHIKAINYLKNNIKKSISFGWLGGGFKVINKSNPCIVKSKGLELWEDKNGFSVLSFYFST